jgi:AAA domain, putative AbiEii toxin, Type IV TA system
MLRRFSARGFKSLADVDVDLARFSVFLGPNAVGKSNLLDALLAFSRLGTEASIADAFQPIRGFPIEAFSFPKGGLPELLTRPEVTFSLTAEIAELPLFDVRYSVTIGIAPATGVLTIKEEELDRDQRPVRMPGGHSGTWLSGPIPPEYAAVRVEPSSTCR